MVSVYLIEFYLVVCILFLAGKDATSYRLQEKDPTNVDVHLGRIKRWHRDGVILYSLFILPLVYFTQDYLIILDALLIRLAFFDIAFNYWAGFNYKYLGSTALVDKFFSRIFGQNGALLKSIVFLTLLILLNIFT